MYHGYKSYLEYVLHRLELFKKLEPNFKIAKVVYIKNDMVYDTKRIGKGAYIVSKPFKGRTGVITALINLEIGTIWGHSMDICNETHNQGFTCWRVKLEIFKRDFKVSPFSILHEFLYKGDKVDD